MKRTLQTDGKPGTLLLNVFTKQEQPIRIIVRDKFNKNTKYIDKTDKVTGEGKFYLRMPLMPRNAELIIFNEKNGNKPEGVDRSFKAGKTKLVDLKRKLNCFDYSNPVIKNFVEFAEEFSQNASKISAGKSVYTSNDGEFVIEYFDDITDSNGRKLNTPARISQKEGVIQISKNKFLNYTIPMRMIILLHEFAHFYLNKDMSNETEADLNALLIYLGLGYPRFEAFYAFLKVFYNSPSPENKERYEYIHKFIQDFEKYKMCITYDSYNIKQAA